MTDNLKSALEKFQQVQDREKALGVWESCGSSFKIQKKQNAVGVLLIHGFGSSPYEMKGLADHLFQAGNNVYSVRLSGHATNLEDFAKSGSESWLISAEEAYEIIIGVSSRIFIIGQSLGAGISLILGSKVKPGGIVSLACILNFMDRKIKFTSIAVIRKLFPYVTIKVDDDDKGYVYDRRPTTAISELLKVRDSLIKNLPDLQSPLLLIQAEDDPVIHPKSAEIIFSQTGSKVKEILKLKEGGHRLTLLQKPNRDTLFNKIVSFLEEQSDRNQDPH
ncbi:MAG: alpha/beta fold hydrolase [Candidatus Marinimicrobia bacterium]|nr:alpha/beta fold hydrolase [Candidatus Neomarinimicrobiota bacterium]